MVASYNTMCFGSTSRDLRIDFLRGGALLIIFSDHVPGNLVADYTPLAVGFSDMAEVFTFLSGYACGRSYGQRLVEQGFANCLRRASIRAGQIFVANIIITILTLLLLVPLEGLVSPRFLGMPWNIELVKKYPLETFLLVETVRLELYQFCVLTLYIPLLLSLPFMLVGFYMQPWRMFGVSLIVYAATQCFPQIAALPTPWREAVFFNPFAWQFLFFSGATLALLPAETRSRLHPPWPAALVAIVLLISALYIHERYEFSRIPWTGKPNLEWLRLLHFGAVVIAGTWTMPAIEALSRAPICRLVNTCGRYSLVGYCAAGVLAILGEAAFVTFSRDWPIQILVNTAGWIGCILITKLWGALHRSKFEGIHFLSQKPKLGFVNGGKSSKLPFTRKFR